MSRTVAVIWHALFSIAAGVLYFFFTLPRWPELLGDTSHTLGTVLRVVTGALIGVAALPVVFTLLRTRRPEFGTPQLALTLRTWSIILHVLAGVLIVGTAITEIWLSIDAAGPWLFGSYGAAAAIALLGMFAFYLAFVAELPPPPPKPLKPRKPRKRRKDSEDDAQVDEADEAGEAAEAAEATSEDAEVDADADEKPAEVTAEAESTAEEAQPDDDEATGEQPEEAESTSGKLRNRRPSAKTEATGRRRRRSRGGVAIDD